MHLAASEGHSDVVKFLIERGAKVNRNDRWGNTPLDDAHRHRYPDVIKYLRDQGASFGTSTRLPRFIQAASEGDVNEIRALLEYGNINLDEGDYDHRTALHLASGEGKVEVVELLCMAGANTNVEDRWGNRPMDDAKGAKENSEAIMKVLVNYGADSKKDRFLRTKVQAFLQGDTSTISQKPTLKRKVKEEEVVVSSSGTVAYWAPELVEEHAQPTPKSDVWAAGVIVSAICTVNMSYC